MLHMSWRTIACTLFASLLLWQTARADQPAVKIETRHGNSWRGTVDGMQVLMLRGTHRERGEAHGRLAGPEITKSCGQLADLLQSRLPGGWQASVIVSKQFQLPKRYREELEGMLAGIQQSTSPEQRTLKVTGRELRVDDLVLLNTPDVFELFKCSQFSAWGKATPDGDMIVGRNFDYPPILPRDNFCIIAVEPSEAGLHSTMDALFFGFTGCGISAIRDDGIYIAPNTGGKSPREILPKEPIASGLVLRTFMETANPETAIEELTKNVHAHFALLILLHVVPAKSELGKQTPIILEFSPSATEPRSVARKPEAGVPSLFVANHHCLNAADLDKGRCGILKSECEKCIAGGKQIGFEEALQMLHAARQDTTFITAVTWPHSGRMKVAIAEPGKVATESKFYSVEWKGIFGAK
jgi:hypothetical protein